jgi:hypothetical protein
MLVLWSDGDDVTYADPASGIQRGREALRAYLGAGRAAELDESGSGQR